MPYCKVTEVSPLYEDRLSHFFNLGEPELMMPHCKRIRKSQDTETTNDSQSSQLGAKQPIRGTILLTRDMIANEQAELVSENNPSPAETRTSGPNAEKWKEIPSGNDLLQAVKTGNVDDAIAMLEGKGEVYDFSPSAIEDALFLSCRHGQKFLVQALVRCGANIHRTDDQGNTPLLICANAGFRDIASFLLRRGANVNAYNAYGNTALILSIRPSGSSDLVKLLGDQAGIKFNHQNQDGYTALMKAIELRDVDVVKLLLEKIKESEKAELRRRLSSPGIVSYNFRPFSVINTIVNNNGETAQEVADRVGLGKVVKLLSEDTKDGVSPLLGAALTRDFESAKIFLDCEFSDSRETFLEQFLRAHQKGVDFTEQEIAIVKTLLERGVRLNDNCSCSHIIVAIEAGSFELVRLFCEFGAKLNVKSRDGKDPLMLAAESGRPDLVRLLLSYNAAVNKLKFSYNDHELKEFVYTDSALDLAFRKGYVECAKLLLEQGAFIDFGEALKSAVENKKPKYVKFLLEQFTDECKNACFNQVRNESIAKLFSTAVKGENLEIISLLLNAGADVNFAGEDEATPLMMAKSADVARLLISRGALVNKKTTIYSRQSTALLRALTDCYARVYASLSSGYEVVKVLLENGAEVNAASNDGRSPLMIAAMNNFEKALELLLKHGADITLRDRDDKTALFLAIEGRHTEVSRLLIQSSVLQKEDLNVQSNDGSTALIAAARHGSHKLIKLLIENGADANIKDVNGETALMWIVKEGYNDESLKTIISASAEINCQNNSGLSALMIAVQKLNKPAVELLLDSGADVNAASRTMANKTALSFLFEPGTYSREHFSLIEYLLSRGASSANLKPEVIPIVILKEELQLVTKLISGGLGPADVTTCELLQHVRNDRDLLKVSTVFSPLSIALLKGYGTLARYFAGNWFLTNSDVSLLPRNRNVRQYLEKQEHKTCLEFLDEFSLHSMPLLQLAFVTVSSAIGSVPGRKDRVGKLPLPPVMKESLLFKKENIRLELPGKKAAVSSYLERVRMSTMLIRGDIRFESYGSDDFYHDVDAMDHAGSLIYSEY